MNTSLNKRRLLSIFGIAIIVVALPITLILVNQKQDSRSSAAAPDKLEAEGGVLGGNATAKADSQASGGQYVAFGTNSTPTQTPAPTSGAYAATYTASSATDQTAALKSFIESHPHQRIALSGVIPVTSVAITLPAGSPRTIIDFLPGARIQGISVGVHGIFRLNTSFDVTLNDPWVIGTGYDWVGSQDPNQYEAGIQIAGGGRITINRPVIRDTRGDGIFVSPNDGSTPANIEVYDVDIQRVSRQGIAITKGAIFVSGGLIDRVGCGSIDLEPDTGADAATIYGVFQDLRLTRYGNLPAALAAGWGDYQIAAGGSRDGIKQRVEFRNISGDRLQTLIRDATTAIVTDSDSDVSTNTTLQNVTSVTFTNNLRMTRI